jgi:radical SAM protein with 4Fe4S-binding SPASM domain
VTEWQKFGREFLRPVHPPETSDQLYHCGGGIDSFAINPYGEMSICVLSQKDKYDLRKGTVRDGWDHFLGRVRQKKTTRLTKCVACSLKSMCGMCPANGELEHGDPEAPVDFLCQVAHLRAHAFGFEVPPHGDCEYCEHGERHDNLMRSVTALKSIEPQAHVESRRTVGMSKLLPMVGAAAPTAGGCGSGGCSSCGGQA